MADQDVLFRIVVEEHAQTPVNLRTVVANVRATVDEINRALRGIEQVQVPVPQINRVPASVGQPQGPSSNYDVQVGVIGGTSPQSVLGGPNSPRFTVPNPAYAPPPTYVPPRPVAPSIVTPPPPPLVPPPVVPPPPPPVAPPVQPTTPVQKRPSGDDHLSAIVEMHKEYNDLGRESDELTGKLSRGFREFSQVSGELAEGIGRTAQGLAFLGANSKDVQSVVDTLLTVKGSVDVFVGIAKTITTAGQAVSLYGERQQMAGRLTAITTERQNLARQAAQQLTAMLQQHGMTLDQLARKNRALADALRQVAVEGRNAAMAQGAGPGPVVGGAGRNGRGSAAGGIAGGLAGSVVTGGFAGLAGAATQIGIEYLVAAAVAAGAARAGAGLGAGAGAGAGAGGGFGVAGIATTAGAAAAALTGVALAAVTAKQSLEGIGRYGFMGGAQKGSLTDSIGAYEARFIDSVTTMVGNAFKYVGVPLLPYRDGVISGDEKATLAGKRITRLEQNRTNQEIEASTRAIEIRAGFELSDAQRADRDFMSRFRAPVGIDQLEALKLQQQNAMRELQTQQVMSGLAGMDRSFGGQMKVADFAEQARIIRDQIRGNQQNIGRLEASGGESAKERNARNQLELSRELQSVNKSLAEMEQKQVTSGQDYEETLKRSIDLAQNLKAVEEERKAIVNQEREDRRRANAEAAAALNQRIGLLRSEASTAMSTLKGGAERFAQLNPGDQFRAKQAIEQARAVGPESLSDTQRRLLRSIGTQEAVTAAERADLSEARSLGFFNTFGSEEQQKIKAAQAEERKVRVELSNLPEVNVKVDADYDRIAVAVADQVFKVMETRMEQLKKAIEAKTKQQQTQNATQAAQSFQAGRSARGT